MCPSVCEGFPFFHTHAVVSIVQDVWATVHIVNISLFYSVRVPKSSRVMAFTFSADFFTGSVEVINVSSVES